MVDAPGYKTNTMYKNLIVIFEVEISMLSIDPLLRNQDLLSKMVMRALTFPIQHFREKIIRYDRRKFMLCFL